MAATTRTRLLLREMTHADIPAVRRIEVAAYADAWPATTFEQELRNAFATYLVAVDVTPAEEATRPQASWIARLFGRQGAPSEPIAGYVGAWYLVDQLHVVTIAVAPERQGRGIGQRLLLECFDRARAAELRNVALEVRPSNHRARAIYERFGFRQQGIARAYYANNGEDAIVMLTPDLDDPEQQARLEALRHDLAERFRDIEWVTPQDEPAG